MKKNFLRQQGDSIIKQTTILRGLELFNSETLFSKNNKVWIKGKISNEFEFFEIGNDGVAYFRNEIVINRISGKTDKISILIPKDLIEIKDYIISKGVTVEICGEFNSKNWVGKDKKSHLDLFITVTAIRKLFEKEKININNIYLDGYICKPVKCRDTPLGKKIADINVAINYDYKESSYIPCIAWDNDARFVSDLNVGDRIKIFGRIQSRKYFKKYEGFELLENPIEKIAIEVSIKYIGIISKNEKFAQIAR